MSERQHSQEQSALLETLRALAKTRGITYRDISERLGLSEQTIKRFFGGQDATIGRLVDVCSIVGVDFFELVRLTETPQEKTFELTPGQDEFFASYPEFFAFYVKLRNNETIEEIQETHQLSEQSVYKYLRQLDKIGLVELSANNRYRLVHRGSLNFSKRSKLMIRIGKEMSDELYDFSIAKKGDGPLCLWSGSDGLATDTTIREFKQDLTTLLSQYRMRAHREGELLPRKNLVPFAWRMSIAAPFSYAISSERIPNLP
jgi:transcriptional regulator with XRE-family HTH domain